MSRLYKVSADTSEKEKAVGGIMTFGQAGWLVLGFILAAALFLLLANFMPPIVALIFSIPSGASFGMVFAFYTKEQLPLFTYLLYQYQFNKKRKTMVNTLTYQKKFFPTDELFK